MMPHPSSREGATGGINMAMLFRVSAVPAAIIVSFSCNSTYEEVHLEWRVSEQDDRDPKYSTSYKKAKQTLVKTGVKQLVLLSAKVIDYQSIKQFILLKRSYK